jgi:signal transduction histidine kinase
MLLTPPQSGQDEIAERGGVTLLYVLAGTLLGIGVVNSGFQLFLFGKLLPGQVAAIALAVLIFWLLQRNRPKDAATFFIVGLLVVLVINSILNSTGVYAVAWVGLPIASMTSGWLLGRRAAVVASIVGIACVWSIYLLGENGFYVVQLQSSIFVGVTLSAATIMGALIGITTSRSFAQQLASVLALSEELRRSNVDLEVRIKERTTELTETLEKLKATQHTLIENEKLASLGAMVAGISHELNTPLGNIQVVNSTVKEQTSRFAKALASGDVRRSALDAHVQSAFEASELIEISTRKAIELISNFKRVSVDQTSEQRRQFDLAEVVQSDLSALAPRLQRCNLKVQVDIPSGIRCDSYPGPLGQIIANLMINTTVHAYAPEQGGTVHIHADIDGPGIRLTVSDNGKGMDSTVLAHVFDPFFTTQLGKGGSGLGLSISKRIATNVLGGDLLVTSVPNEGARITICFPQVAPGSNLSDIHAVFESRSVQPQKLDN